MFDNCNSISLCCFDWPSIIKAEIRNHMETFFVILNEINLNHMVFLIWCCILHDCFHEKMLITNADTDRGLAKHQILSNCLTSLILNCPPISKFFERLKLQKLWLSFWSIISGKIWFYINKVHRGAFCQFLLKTWKGK